MQTEKFGKFPIHEFMRDIQRILADGEYLLVLGLMNDHVQVMTEPVESLTVYGREVENPEKYVDIINDLKENAIKGMIKNQLPMVQKYIEAHSDTQEAQFLYGLINRLNKDSTSKDYYNILMLAKNAVAQLPVDKPTRAKMPSWTTDQKSEYLQACNQVVKCMENLIAECLVFEYPANSKGEISTSAFEKWNKRPNLLDVAAITDPGATLRDITRDVKIGEKGVFDFNLEVIQEDAKIRQVVLRELNKILVEIKDPEMVKAAAKLLGMSIDDIHHGRAGIVNLQNMVKQYPVRGNGKAEELFEIIKENIFDKREEFAIEAGYNPGHFDEKKRLIKILRALDEGLMLGDAYAKVYQEYERVYDLCQKLKMDYPQWQSEIDLIARTAKTLLLAHSRDYAELIKGGGDDYHIKEPKVIINQVKQAEEILQKKLDKLIFAVANGAFDLEKLVKNLLHERAEVVKKYPDKVAVKEELLSVKQNVQNGLYLAQVQESFSLQGEPVTPASPEIQDTAIVFDGKGGAFIQLEAQQGRFAAGGNMIAMNSQGHVFQIETGKEPRRPDLLSLKMKVHFTAVQDARAEKGKVPEVATTLTELKFTRGSPDLEFTPKGGKPLDEDVELKSRHTLNSGA